ncbi:hypothetical protein [Neisseria canis]|nr:hypothetical protein [Neisseria canis]
MMDILPIFGIIVSLAWRLFKCAGRLAMPSENGAPALKGTAKRFCEGCNRFGREPKTVLDFFAKYMK